MEYFSYALNEINNLQIELPPRFLEMILEMPIYRTLKSIPTFLELKVCDDKTYNDKMYR